MQKDGLLAVGKPTRRSFCQKTVPKMKDPSGGTTGRVKPYGALGVDGRSRRIQPMGRDYRSHIDKSQHPRRTFKTPGDFFNLLFGGDCRKNHCAAGYFAPFAADLSDAIDGRESFSARLTEALSTDGSSAGVFSPAGLPETEASGTAGVAVAAVTAA
jgi:hypothetical protein